MSMPPCSRLHGSHELHQRERISHDTSTVSTTVPHEIVQGVASHVDTPWWERFRSTLCSSIIREELRGDFSCALRVTESVLQNQDLSLNDRIDAYLAKGLTLLYSGRPQSAVIVLDEVRSLVEDGTDHARHLRCLVWLQIALDEAYSWALDNSNISDDAVLRAKFGSPEDNLPMVRSRHSKIKEIGNLTKDQVSLEEYALFDFKIFYVLAKMYAFSLCPANIAVPVPERAYLEKASDRINRARCPPPLARGSTFAKRQHIRLCSMCLPREQLLTAMKSITSMYDDHDRGLASLLECDLLLCRIGASVEYWGTIAALGGWSTAREGVLFEEFYRPTSDEIERASKLVTIAHKLFDGTCSPRGVASAYLRRSFCAALKSKWTEGEEYAKIARERFRAVRDAYGENVAQLHVVLCSIGASPYVDPSRLAFSVGKWGATVGSYSVSISLGRLLLRVASQYWLVRNGRIMEALACCRAARGLFEGLGSRLGVANAMVCESAVLHLCGAAHEEVMLLQDTLSVFRKMGNVSSEMKLARRTAIAEVAAGLLKAYLSVESPFTGLEHLLDDVRELFGFKSGDNSVEAAKELLQKFEIFFRDGSLAFSGTAANAKVSFSTLHYITMMTQIFGPAIKASRLQFRDHASEDFRRLEALALYNIDVFAGNPREKKFYMSVVYGLLHNYNEQKKAAQEHYHLLFEYSSDSVLEQVHLPIVVSINPDGTRQQRTKDISEVQGYVAVELGISFSVLVKAGAWSEARECLESLNKFHCTSNWWRLEQDNLSYGDRIAVLLSKEGNYDEAIKLFDECIAISDSTLCSMLEIEKRSYRLRSASPVLLFHTAAAVHDYLMVLESQNRNTKDLHQRLFAYLDATKARTMLDLEASNKLISKQSGRRLKLASAVHSSSNKLVRTAVVGEKQKQLEEDLSPYLHRMAADIDEWQAMTWNRAALSRITAKLQVEGDHVSGSEGSRASDWKKARLKKSKKALDACDKKLHEVAQRISRENPFFTQWMNTHGKTISLEEAQACLPMSTILVQYFVSARNIFILVVTKNHGLLEHKSVAIPESKLQAIVERFICACGTEPLAVFAPVQDPCAEFSKAATEMSTVLIDPIKECLHDISQELSPESVRLIFVPHRCLNNAPLHALSWCDGEPLAFSFVTSYLHSASELQFYKTEPITSPIQIGGGRCLLVGNPYRMSYMNPITGAKSDRSALEGSAEEVHTLQSVLRNHETACVVLTEEKATLSNFREWLFEEAQDCSTSKILHLATHFVYCRDAPLLSAFLLSDGQKLTILMLCTQRTELDLVVLSACSSAYGESTDGGDFCDAVEALRAAGVRRVVASLWPVRDLIASETMKIFYKNMLEGNECAAALQTAQMAVRKRFRHPCYWAPFILIG